MMGQPPEQAQNETPKAAMGAADHTSGNTSDATICVYGHGPTKNPFYREARISRRNSKGALLFLGAPVSCGQKLLLMGSAMQNPAEAEIVNTRLVGPQMFEVEVVFGAPGPDFRQPLHGEWGRQSKEIPRHPLQQLL